MCRKSILLFFLIACFVKVKAQLNTFLPNGKPIFIKGENLKPFLDSLGIVECNIKTFSGLKAIVFYKQFVNEPILILSEDVIDKMKAEAIIKSCKYAEYLYSDEYVSDIDFLVSKKCITKKYLRSIYKEKSILKKAKGEWLIKELNTIFFFEKEVVKGAVRLEVLPIENNVIKLYDYFVRSYYSSTLGFECTIKNLKGKLIKSITINAAALDNNFKIVETKTIKEEVNLKLNVSYNFSFKELFFPTKLYHLSIEGISVEYADKTITKIEKKDIQKMINFDIKKRTEYLDNFFTE